MHLCFGDDSTSQILAFKLPLFAEDGRKAAQTGPMAAYEREIASGHLKPGDKDQVLRVLWDQRASNCTIVDWSGT